jgi:uncharacterized membrane protein YhaH (DUF805 family)
MSIFDYYLDAFRKYATFEGRATRPDYWWFTLVNFIIVLGLEALIWTFVPIPSDTGQVAQNSPTASILAIVTLVYLLATIIPNLALTVRRLHDTDRSGWWIFVNLIPLAGPIWLLVLLCMPSDPRINRFG